MNAEDDHYQTLFSALSTLATRGTFLATDVGSSIQLYGDPYHSADAALGLGSAIALAGGYTRGSGSPAVAVIGDYGLLHSGLESLIEMHRRGIPGVVVVLVNEIMAQTGGQPIAVPGGEPGALMYELRKLVVGAGVTRIIDWCADDWTVDETVQRLDELLGTAETVVALVRSSSAIDTSSAGQSLIAQQSE